MIEAPESGFRGPVKRSVTIAGHQTSISLEPIFWKVLEAAAVRLELPLSALVAQIDAVRIMTEDPPNLASAIRSWILCSLDPPRNGEGDHLPLPANGGGGSARA
ncbi:MAG: ribbon-helix-helix domain-containing protein [Pseudomonadota bacterium]|nr:ribbon-helix-helix domain-containing protein [Pseudomonadota bacterium]